MPDTNEDEERAEACDDVDLDGLHLTSVSALLPMLARLPHLRSLRLSNNALRGLPHPFATLTSLESLDLSGNPLDGAASVLPGLRGLRALRHLRADLPHARDVDEVCAALPSLLTYNGNAVHRVQSTSAPPTTTLLGDRNECSSGSSSSRDAWAAAQRDGAEQLFAAVRPCVDDAAACSMAFATHMDEVVRELVTRTTRTTKSPSSARRVMHDSNNDNDNNDIDDDNNDDDDDAARREGDAMRAEARVLDFCFAHMAAGASTRGDDAVAHAVAALRAYTMSLCQRYDAHWRHVLRDRHTRLSLMKRDMQHAARELQALLAALARNHRDARTDDDDTDAMAVAARTDADAPHASAASAADAVTTVPHTPPRPLTLPQLRRLMRDVYASKAAYDARCTHHTNNNNKSNSNSSRQRRTSMPCLPRETMEQHLYIFLAQRYGLASLVVEWVVSVAHAVRQYAADDAEVALFGKVLRNEVDEAFVDVVARLRAAVRARVRRDVPARHDTDCATTTTSRGRGTRAKTTRHSGRNNTAHDNDGDDDDDNDDDVRARTSVLSLRQWATLVRELYNDDDARRVIALLRRAATAASPSRVHGRGRMTTATTTRQREQQQQHDVVSVDVALSILLAFQLDQHERLLAPYVALFRAHDTDHDGVVSRSDFAAIARRLDADDDDDGGGGRLSADDVRALCARADAGAHDRVTFSSGATVLRDVLARLYRRDVHVSC